MSIYTGNEAKDNATTIYGNIRNLSLASHPGSARASVEKPSIRSLKVIDPKLDKTDLERNRESIVEECYTWVFADPSFRRWYMHEDSRLLWIRGGPGRGKTMIMIGLIRSLTKGVDLPPVSKSSWPFQRSQAKSNPAQLSYFFCRSNSILHDNTLSVLKGLVYRLLADRDDLVHHLHQYSKMHENPFDQIAVLQNLLSDILNDESMPRVYLFVDALDECSSDMERTSLFRVIREETLAKNRKIKWVISSRDIPDVVQNISAIEGDTCAILELDTRHAGEAVKKYIKIKFEDLAKTRVYDSEMRAAVEKNLYEKAEDTFLWVSLICNTLKSEPLCSTMSVFHGLELGLSPLYKKMMDKTTEVWKAYPHIEKFCKDILRSIVLGYRRIRIEELSAVAKLPTEQFGTPEKIKDIVRYCGSFLEVHDGEISLVHLSVKEWFLTGNGFQSLGCTTTEGHSRTLQNLLDVMQSKLHKDMCNLERPGALVHEVADQIKKSSFLQNAYAYEHWITHLLDCVEHDTSFIDDSGKIHKFLQSHLLHWLEAMSLLEKIPEAVAALHQLHGVLSESESPVLSNLVHDALRIVMWSRSGLRKAPLQIYNSALVFAPEKSFVRAVFGRQVPDWVEVRSNVDAAWGPLLQTLEKPDDISGWPNTRSVAFLADAEQVASVSCDQSVSVWDVKSGKVLRTLRGHTGVVTSIAISPRGDMATGSEDQTIQIWDALTGKKSRKLLGHTNAVSSVAFAPNGNLASASHDKTIILWNTDSGKVLHRIKGHKNSVNCVAFAPNSDMAIVASGSDDWTVRLWSTQTGKLLRTFQGHNAEVTSVALSRYGDLASGSRDCTIRLWNMHTGDVIHELQRDAEIVRCVAFSARKHRMASASDYTIQLWDTDSGTTLHTFGGHACSMMSLDFSPQGYRIASASEDGIIQVWDAKISEILKTSHNHTNLVSIIVFSPSGHRFASGSWDKSIVIWDTETAKLLRTLKGHTDEITSLAFSATGDQLASASRNNTVCVWDVERGKLLKKLEGHKGSVNCVVFSPQGHLASASDDLSVKFWDLKKGTTLSFQGHTKSVANVAFCPEGHLIASASYDCTIRVCDTRTGLLNKRLVGHLESVSIVAFSPLTGGLASASWDKTIRLWDLRSGRTTRKIINEEQIRSLAYSTDGLCLVTDKGTIELREPTSKTSSSSSLFRLQEMHIIVKNSWIVVNSQRCLWLPIDYRPECVATSCNFVALGCSSGRVVLLKFGDVL